MVKIPSSPNADPGRKSSGPGSARKVLQVLFAFSERRVSATVPELAELLGTPVPTVYRHVALLKEMQLLESGEGGSVHPTARVMSLARAAQLSDSLADLARPIIAETSREFNETVMLMQRFGGEVVCVELTECDRPMRFTFWRGHTLPLGVGASGKVALSMLPETIRAPWTNGPAGDALGQELIEIRERGYVVSESAIDAGIWACSVPVIPSASHPVVLTVVGPGSRIETDLRERAPAILKHSAERIRTAASEYSY